MTLPLPLALRAICGFRWILRALRPTMKQVRLAAYAFVVFGALSFAASRSVYADMSEVGLGVGHELAKLEDLTSGAYTVHVNGAEIHRASARTTQSVTAVLDRYEAYCRSAPSALGQAMQDIPGALEQHLPLMKDAPARAGVIREEKNGRGMVACLVDDHAVGGLDALRQKLDAFRRSGDLSELGRFRYVFAESAKTGTTHVVTLWSNGPLNLGLMFPPEGDAPGTDSAIAPRPRGSRRTLCASVDGFPAAVRIYELAAEPSAVLAAQASALRTTGFQEVVVPNASHPHDGITTSNATTRAAYVRPDGAQVFLMATGSGGRTSLSAVEIGAGSLSGITIEKESR